MKNRATAAVLTVLLLLAAAPQAHAQQEKLAQTGFKFLSLSVDARAAAMGGAVTSVEGGSTALLYNAAAMAHQEDFLHLGLSNTRWIGDITYNAATLSLRPFGGRFGTVGFSLVSVDYGEFQETVRFDNEQGFLDLGTFSPSALALGVGYARALTDRFSVGGQVKMARQNLGDSVDRIDDGGELRVGNEESVLAFDFGMLYRTGFRSLNFAVSARNFSQEIVYAEESFQLPLTLKLGVSMDVTDLAPAVSSAHRLLVALDVENPRDYKEQVKLGGEYWFLDMFALRGGYVFPTDEQGVSLGVGIQQSIGGIGFGGDYAYTDVGIFNDFNRVHRVALHVSF